MKEKTRRFGGKLNGFESKKERAFQKAHLKAYLNGDAQFTWGRHPDTNAPMWWKVLEEWA